ncbi:MAG: STAS/SEC14 domain-containing protein [Stellaceae bacterium]
MIEIIEGFPKNVVGIAVKGRVTMQDCRQILTPAIENSLKWRDKIRLYYEINSRFPGAGWDDLDFGFEHAARCERVAIVTDIAWVGLTIRALRFLIPGEIRVFATIQADEGRAWITARAGSRTEMPAATGRRSSRTRQLPHPAPARVAATARAHQPSHGFA